MTMVTDSAARPLIGAHCGGGIRAAFANAIDIGAECLQVFVAAPQMWRAPKFSDADVEAFIEAQRTSGLGPVFIHAIYLLNLGSSNPVFIEKSIQSLRDHLMWANRLGVDGVIFHPGSAGTEPYGLAEDRAVAALQLILDGYDGKARLLLETCAGQGATIGRSFEELASLMRRMDDDPRLGVCLDTCHVFAAGYPLHEPDGPGRILADFDSIIGVNRLACIHVNDSKGAFSSNVDRHENIGAGRLGDATFARLMEIPEIRNIPLILEVPGLEGEGPDRANMDILKLLRRDGLAAVRPTLEFADPPPKPATRKRKSQVQEIAP